MKEIEKTIAEILGVTPEEISLEYAKALSHGDYTTSVALIRGAKEKISPLEIAEKCKEKLQDSFTRIPDIEKVEVVNPGFINFFLTRTYFSQKLLEIAGKENLYGRSESLSGVKAIFEYTDPNLFKEFHIGHFMSNTVGETLSRMSEWLGAEVKRACYQGDVGLHVAKCLKGIEALREKEHIFPPPPDAPLGEQMKFLGKAYALGSSLEGEGAKEVATINKAVYERSLSNINVLYDKYRKVSLDYFETMYEKFGTKFDFYFFESESGVFGKELVEKFLEKGTFKESEGAIIFDAKQYEGGKGLHTRVFINSYGIPTYEAKELGLAKIKFDKYPYDLSVVITGNEVNDYFRVLLVAMKEVFPELALKTKHLSHGMLRLPKGKMSSRAGNIISAETLIEMLKEKVLEKMKDSEVEDKEKVAEQISIGAIKYSILKQAIGKDVIFDLEKSLSFEGDSGPYLQYTASRIRSILRKADDASIPEGIGHFSQEATSVERLLIRFPDVVIRAHGENSPQLIASYLITLASEFNSFYANNRIVDGGVEAPFRLSLSRAVLIILQNGLHLLGIPSPERM